MCAAAVEATFTGSITPVVALLQQGAL